MLLELEGLMVSKTKWYYTYKNVVMLQLGSHFTRKRAFDAMYTHPVSRNPEHFKPEFSGMVVRRGTEILAAPQRFNQIRSV